MKIILNGCLLTPHVTSDSSFGNDWFYYPLGDKAWTFEDGVTTGWTTNRAGCLSSSVYADSPYSWYTSGGGEYTMDYVVNTDHAL